MLRSLLLFVILTAALHASAPEVRIWQTVRGQKIEGSLARIEGGNVILQKKNSKQTVTVPREELMPVDTMFLESLEKKSTPPAPSKTKPAEPGAAPIPLPGESEEDDLEIPGDPTKGKLYPRSKDEIRSGLRTILQRDKPKELGREVHEAICRLNAYRFLSGLSAGVGTEPHMLDGAQDASKACAEAGKISHSLGHSTDRCNLSSGHHDMAATVDGYIGDGGDNNRAQRGHRRWCLNPPMKNAGFGREGTFSAMWCMDSSGTKSRDGWSYPGRGLYPRDYVRGNAWSYYHIASLPPDTTVKMWKITARPEQLIPRGETPKGREIPVEYTHVYDNTINWEPETKGKRGIYWVRIDGRSFHEQYVVELF